MSILALQGFQVLHGQQLLIAVTNNENYLIIGHHSG